MYIDGATTTTTTITNAFIISKANLGMAQDILVPNGAVSILVFQWGTIPWTIFLGKPHWNEQKPHKSMALVKVW